MATWTAMDNLSAGDLVTEADMDAIRGNIEYLLTPNSDINERTTSNYTTTSSTFADVDGTNLELTITTYGGPVLVFLIGNYTHSSNGVYTAFDIDVDGTREGGTEGLLRPTYASSTTIANVSFVHVIAGLSAGSHTFTLQWKTDSGTATLYASAGTPCFFGAIEI